MMRRPVRAALTVALLLRSIGACVGEDPDLSSVPAADAGTRPVVDAGAKPVCSGSFGALESLGPAINTANDEYPGRFSGDLLSFVFARRATGSGQPGAQLFVARRSSVDAQFESATPAFAAPSGEHDQEPTFTPWGAIVFHRGEQGSTKLMIAAPADGGFAPPVPLSNAINATGSERSAFVASDGTLYFSRAPGGAGAASNEYDVFTSPANDDRTFAAPKPVPGLTLPGQSETLPIANGAGTVIYFSSVLYFDAGEGGTRDTDLAILRATRASRDVEFGVPQQVPGVNTDRYETTAWVSDDDCTMVIAHRAEAGASIDLFVARRPR